jgi:hypothetical protein
MDLLERLSAPGPKRILALDGGGIRGCITIEFLAEIEGILRERHGDPELRLCDYFDLIGGTSTGAILAAGLSIGMETSELRTLYQQLGGLIFGSKRFGARLPVVGQLASVQYSSAPLEAELAKVFFDRRLDDADIRCGLCIVAKRADTFSTWPLLNHPRGMYYEKNRSMLLRRAVRASTAAPHYFVAEAMDVGGGERGAFVDGGVSMANNPALQLFLVATLQGYPFRWATGPEQLLLVSVGTGAWNREIDVDAAMEPNLAAIADRTISTLMDDASWQNQLVLQAISRSPTRSAIDSEVGDLGLDRLVDPPLLHYLRYNVALEEEALVAMGLGRFVGMVEALRGLDSADRREELAEVGAAAARTHVRGEHFPGVFDVGGNGERGTG